jgi:Tol biopolymer transport system component
MPPERTSFGLAALSPDGRWLAFSGVTDSRTQLWVHALDGTSTRPMAGTDGAVLPFWSPDSRHIGFFAAGRLRRIDLSGGIPATLADVPVPTGGTWNRDGVILFGALGRAGLSQISASGGEVVSVIRPDPNRQETDYLNPFFLPDGHRFLYNILSGHTDRRGVFMGSLDGASSTRLVSENSNAEYAELADGRGVLLFTREGALLAQSFDADRKQLVGEPRRVTAHVGTTTDASTLGVTRRHFTLSKTGVLVFDPANQRRSQLVWSDRTGKRTVLEGFGDAAMLRLSPDGSRFAVARLDERQSGNSDLWISDAPGTYPRRLSFDPGNDIFPIWSPDGTRVAWGSNRDGVYHVYEKSASGSGQDRLLFHTALYKFPTDWARDGRVIVYRQIDPKTGYDIWFAPAEPQSTEFEPTPFLVTAANEAAAVVSPSGKWIAYTSDESGRYEVYVQSFPSGGGKRQISASGGAAPLWRGDGRELFFHAPDGTLMAVPVLHGASMTTGAPIALFSFRPSGAFITPYYSVTADGQRFLLSTVLEGGPGAPLSVLVNWHVAPQGTLFR